MEAVHKLVEWSHKKQEKEAEACTEMSEWEQVVDRAHFMVWRRFVPETQLYQYRVYGHFTDIPSRAFYNTQVDLAYWKDWDKNTLDVRVVEKDKESTSEVVHWVYKFPYPMYPRDYVYVRRYTLDQESNTMVITAKATQHPSCPEDSSCVRVATYTSQMVIKPYTTFDENGFEYVMTYCDDPQTNFPTVCYNWMASTGVHEFLEKVHRAARKKHEKSNESSTARMDNSADNLYAKMAHH
ncbi:stAR-related lipid transfer protein 7, mitochondrial isoform X2 [Aplysia californica]|nr:stAR-related lipid transfer protein 7, mitochondrial isoform X2 [Aplysia californica]